MSVNSYLESLASELVLSSAERSSISTSINAMSSRMDSHFGHTVRQHFQFGSSTRGTILPRRADENSDIDYMVVFDTTNGQFKPQTYLDRLGRFADKYYSRSEVYQSHPTLVLSLNHIKFELVPAIFQYGYHIPSPSSSWLDWLSTDPSGADSKLTEKNTQNAYKIKPLVRLVKYWNARNGHIFRSFEIERYIISTWYWGCSTLWDYYWSFWSGFSCEFGTAQYIKDRVNSAKRRVEKAQEYEAAGMPVSAENEIRKSLPPP